MRLKPEEKSNHPATTPNWDARRARHCVRCQRGKTPPLLKTQPTPSYAYDVSAAIWARTTTALRDKTSNPYDASSGQITMAEKDVTLTKRSRLTSRVRGVSGSVGRIRQNAVLFRCEKRGYGARTNRAGRLTRNCVRATNLPRSRVSGTLSSGLRKNETAPTISPDIAGTVASMTKGEPGVLG